MKISHKNIIYLIIITTNKEKTKLIIELRLADSIPKLSLLRCVCYGTIVGTYNVINVKNLLPLVQDLTQTPYHFGPSPLTRTWSIYLPRANAQSNIYLKFSILKEFQLKHPRVCLYLRLHYSRGHFQTSPFEILQIIRSATLIHETFNKTEHRYEHAIQRNKIATSGLIP